MIEKVVDAFQAESILTDDKMLALRQRNERRAAKARAALGTRWLLHPANRVRRKPVDLGMLGSAR